ncbi:MAG: EAL domain-containing response regulator [Legionellales bacterium]|nr:EAL domain-containing response regulator [Legionellales bacterium]
MTGKSLLILTASEEISLLLQKAAVKNGFVPFLLTSGLGLISSFDNIKPDLMILDLDLEVGDIDGVELLNHFGKAQCKIPIMLLSAGDHKILFSLNYIALEKKLNIIANMIYPFSAEEFEYKLSLTKHNLSVIDVEDLASAIENKHFILHYQPKIEIKTKKWIGVEVLIRWQPPGQRIIMPDDFISLAEESGLILPMTIWVIKQSFEDLLRFQSENLNLKIAVNLSSKLLSDIGFPDEVLRLAKEMNLNPEQICFEVTESATSKQPENVLEVLLRLRLKGFSLSIDDFGTGYSSLVELQRLPFNEMKIDKSFIMGIESTEMNQSIVKAILYLGHTLGLTLVAEGVENVEALSLLTELNCDVAQGYLISPALPIDELRKWHKKNIADDFTWKPFESV